MTPNDSTQFTAKDARPTPTAALVSFNLYANGVLCGRLTMKPAQFDELTARLRSTPLTPELVNEALRELQ